MLKKKPPDAPILSQGTNQARRGSKRRGVKREARSSPLAHRGARVIGTDALRILQISREPSDGQERNQNNKNNPNTNAHQSKPCLRFVPAQRAKESPERAKGSGYEGSRRAVFSRHTKRISSTQGAELLTRNGNDAPRPAAGSNGPGLATTPTAPERSP